MKFFSVMYQTSNSKGQELLAQRMVKWALKLGHEAWLVTSIYHDGSPVISEQELLRTERGFLVLERDPWVGLPTIRVSSDKSVWPPRRIFFRDFQSVLRELDELIGVEFMVTHSTLWNGPEEAARWILWKRLVKILGEEARHTVYAHMSHFQPPDPLRYSVIERAYRMAWNMTSMHAIFRAAHIVICLTQMEAEDMVSMGARPEQIHLFPGGLDDDFAEMIDKASPADFRERYNIPDNKLIIAYLGTIEYRKNPLAVVRVAKKLKHLEDVVFVIAGRPGDQWNEVVAEAKKLSNVVITGELSEEMKASLIKASYANIIMSRMEAFGLTQLEFMYGGVPVITSATYGQKWLVRNGVDGLHVAGPDDVEGAAAAVLKLVNNPDLKNEMGKNARERASQFLFSKLMLDLLKKAEALLSRS